MGEVVLIDGEVFPPGEARISVFDHGFLFGDSVYEVVRTRRGELFLYEPHAERLARSAELLYLELPFSSESLRREVERAVALAGNEESYARIIVTRGVGELELAPSSCDKPTLLIIVRRLVAPDPRLYQEGMKVAIIPRRRTDPRSLSPTAKTGNYLNNVLAIIEARRRQADDAIMLNAEGMLTEGTTANVFFVRDGIVCTPRIDGGILEGITRAEVIRMLRDEGAPVEEGGYGPERLRDADEAFVTSTTRDVMPIRQVDDAVLGENGPGEITRLLMDRFARL